MERKLRGNSTTIERINYIDIAKGIGILLVVLGHGYSNINPVYCWINSFHMPLFFILTGVLFSIKSEKELV